MPTPVFTQVTPHIYKLDLPWRGGRLPVGVWLIRGEDDWTMVDSGAPGFEALVMEQVLVQTGGVKPALLILTHGHRDHAAAAGAIRTQWRVRLAAGRDEITYLVGPEHYNQLPGSFLYRFMQSSPTPLIGRNIQWPLDDGMRLGPLDVFVLKGHTPAMVALLHREDRALLSADAVRNTGGRLSDPSGNFTYSVTLNHAAQDRLAGLDFEHLLPNHGPVLLGQGRAALQAFVARRAQKRKG